MNPRALLHINLGSSTVRSPEARLRMRHQGSIKPRILSQADLIPISDEGHHLYMRLKRDQAMRHHHTHAQALILRMGRQDLSIHL
jgi:hypothetical protein